MSRLKYSFATGLTAIAYCLLASFIRSAPTSPNDPPHVVIVSPGENDRFSWNSIIRYKIGVTDKEDGKSEFEEINGSEVLLEVAYFRDAVAAKLYVDKKRQARENTALTMIRRSDCFTCHASKTKLIGPSFELIAKRYRDTDSTVARLAKNIINGSTGTWGVTAMPAHKSLDAKDARQMTKWILDNGGKPNIAFYPGLEGAFKTDNKPAKGAEKMVLVMTASYTDHGDNTLMENSRYGQHTVSLRSAN